MARRRKSTKRHSKRMSGSKFKSIMKDLRSMNAADRVKNLKVANRKFIDEFSRHLMKLRKSKTVSPAVRKKMKRHANKLRLLVNRRTSVDKRRRILTQKGGILPFLIPLLGGLIGPAIGGIAKAITGGGTRQRRYRGRRR